MFHSVTTGTVSDAFDRDLLPLLRELVAIDSVNPSLVSNGRGEAALARFISDWFKHFDVEATVEEVRPGRPNVVAIVRGIGGNRSILLNAHLDTVGVAGMEKPFSARVADGRLYGRGAMDTKGGLAAFMIATALAARERLAGDVIFAGVIDEEYASVGTESLVGMIHADAAIVAEPTGLEIQICHKGFVWLDVETSGVAAHGSRFEEGVDAIVKMGKFLVALDELSARLQSGPRHPVLGPGSIHASLIAGGQEISSYPMSCRVSVERRTLPGERPANVEAELQSLLDQLRASDSSFRGSCTTTFSRDPLDVETDSPIVEIVSSQIRHQLGREPAFGGSSGWTDAALLADAGIPSIVFGPFGKGLHGLNEWVDLESVRAASSIVLGAIN